MDVSAVNDICDGTYLLKKKVLSNVRFGVVLLLVDIDTYIMYSAD